MTKSELSLLLLLLLLLSHYFYFLAVNPCTRGNGGCQHHCKNNGGKAVCSCKPGFKVDDKSCVDRNECTDGSSKCEQLCINTEGSYKCGCKKGFVLADDKKSCTDVDECKIAMRCDQLCVNTEGSYKCGCKKGFALSANGRSCTGIINVLRRNSGNKKIRIFDPFHRRNLSCSGIRLKDLGQKNGR